MKKISILTLFPEMFEGPFKYSIVKRAQEKKKAEIELINIRDFGIGKHKLVDDKPYGGGVGMVLRVDVIDKALLSVTSGKKQVTGKRRIILLDARGETFTQKKAKELSSIDHLILVCGHYEGVDERVKEHLVDESISIGSYVLTGGELPAMVIIDATVRLMSGVLAKSEATALESFSKPEYLEHPQYTRPDRYKNWSVPGTLLSGNHKAIHTWREEKSLKRKG